MVFFLLSNRSLWYPQWAWSSGCDRINGRRTPSRGSHLINLQHICIMLTKTTCKNGIPMQLRYNIVKHTYSGQTLQSWCMCMQQINSTTSDNIVLHTYTNLYHLKYLKLPEELPCVPVATVSNAISGSAKCHRVHLTELVLLFISHKDLKSASYSSYQQFCQDTNEENTQVYMVPDR